MLSTYLSLASPFIFLAFWLGLVWLDERENRTEGKD